MDWNINIRLAAFKWLEEQCLIHGDILPRDLIEKGFYYQGTRITLIGPQGIWKSKVMDLPISITTILDGPYADSLEENGLLQYKYRGTDPYHPYNIGLRKLMELKIPLIYFFNISKGKYLPTWPVFIQEDNRADLSFTVTVDDVQYLNKETGNTTIEEDDASYGRRAYLTSTIKRRLHQKSFREKVMKAYKSQCALCNLRHIELLDAAHIIPDGEEKGEPIVTNGLALCKIHHAAYDQNILGISPDYIVNVRTNILEEVDGPMLKYGIQALNRSKIILPKHEVNWPDKERLDIRYNRFLNAS